MHIIEWWEPSNEGECNDLLSLSYLTLCLWSIAAVYLYVRADREERKRGEGRNLNGIFITGKTRGNFKFLLNLTSWGATAAATVVAAAATAHMRAPDCTRLATEENTRDGLLLTLCIVMKKYTGTRRKTRRKWRLKNAQILENRRVGISQPYSQAIERYITI